MFALFPDRILQRTPTHHTTATQNTTPHIYTFEHSGPQTTACAAWTNCSLASTLASKCPSRLRWSRRSASHRPSTKLHPTADGRSITRAGDDHHRCRKRGHTRRSLRLRYHWSLARMPLRSQSRRPLQSKRKSGGTNCTRRACGTMRAAFFFFETRAENDEPPPPQRDKERRTTGYKRTDLMVTWPRF